MLPTLKVPLTLKRRRCSCRVSYIYVLCFAFLLLFFNAIYMQGQYGILSKLRVRTLDEEDISSESIATNSEKSSPSHADTRCDIKYIMERQELSLSLSKVQTRLSGCTRIFYNRVPKCASRTILTAFKLLSRKNKFNHIAAERGMLTNYFQQFKDLEAFPGEFLTYEPPVLYSRHLHFVNFSQFGYPMPVYINVIRDPVDRLMSHYYFNHFGSVSQHKNRTWSTKEEDSSKSDGKHSLEKCIQQKSSSCLLPYLNKVLPFFCGHNTECVQGDSAIHLRLAKKIVQDHYLVVGMTEDISAFMTVLEILMPKIFANVTHSFKISGTKAQMKYKTVKKYEISDKSRAILMKILANEYDFYHFVRQRFYNLHNRIIHAIK